MNAPFLEIIFVSRKHLQEIHRLGPVISNRVCHAIIGIVSLYLFLAHTYIISLNWTYTYVTLHVI